MFLYSKNEKVLLSMIDLPYYMLLIIADILRTLKSGYHDQKC